METLDNTMMETLDPAELLAEARNAPHARALGGQRTPRRCEALQASFWELVEGKGYSKLQACLWFVEKGLLPDPQRSVSLDDLESEEDFEAAKQLVTDRRAFDAAYRALLRWYKGEKESGVRSQESGAGALARGSGGEGSHEGTETPRAEALS